MSVLLGELVATVAKAGRWLIRRLVKWGIRKLIGFVEARIDTFEYRLGRARSKRRKRWLRWKIAWRVKLLVWLKKRRCRLTKRASRTLEKQWDKLGERVPWDVLGERYATWVRRYA